ncbi:MULTISPECIES: N-acetyl-1-D-myo-inositol-2-amino-2-deoxy-alpha-D-glucopyranoside deacetylase [Mycolicibacterium]|jgi:N-acetyl-1-D-myo-inositol-2-amino-2-deoxy-alpha-D-glucopyranoside deacetylase|uniref:1D-myo-inositol 2-acetamido-2-deoxy-alpha-D-glucopyranoside deacetylase n=2 Tax=Mycolicibacterium TaxID=1866885 RepID=MSHB_MYCVP|nr:MULTISPECIES: N-acetyl-1-D-myo-inositol-2-amino-2-deoxy-alpha-D-glucopyranoside deacetylase [Mycolicibacterium]A1TDR0.1 RecName: Full=1D-myo-inositol 2-acetamido-2-deoxy-alpha-D-glucopyranoside deacetylase; Short=GlcNAc-Ins deacetylase; AltName: Full=N-acetyl-1-D-myo-inositol 2-amino-2-deoxy-alpha-D-glucopyranoside deacetylase [Mycolicibacterium vanbaalenii PYR-1]ABM15310.1 LmbE family protein [Mycolicibacterium vanbaalenii PYR-1]MCV7128022.1 N-acetyl-1-D-myo-inositol-2-amino-2-deoxy-alpha-D-
METARLLFVHAHPDDETLTTGATIAHYVARGAQVHVITCTLGEEGEVIGDEWAQLAVDRADQLGGYRIGELTAALAELGVDRPRFLGGAGRWRDSGMDGTPARQQQRFVDGDFAEQTATLAAAIDELRPHVVVTYDPNGGYGHPDHIHAHRVTTAAVAASTWQVPKLYWTVTSSSALAAALASMGAVPEEWIRVSADDLPLFGYSDEAIDAALDLTAHESARVAALRAHRTQVSVSPDGRSFALSNNVALPVDPTEYYVLAAGSAGARDERGWETDLLSGLSVG